METVVATTAAAPATSSGVFGSNWRTIVVVGVLLAVVWWVWRERSKTKPEVMMQPNLTPAPPLPPGIPLTLGEKMAQLIDTSIPVVLTSGSPVPHDDDEIRQLLRVVLGRLNALGEAVTLTDIVSVAKTQDSYKTVAYDIVCNVYDARANVGMMQTISLLVPMSGTLYIRQYKMTQDVPSKAGGGGLGAASDPVEYAAYEDPMAVLGAMKVV